MIQESEENTCAGVRWLSSASVYCDDLGVLAASPYAYMFVARDLQECVRHETGELFAVWCVIVVSPGVCLISVLL